MTIHAKLRACCAAMTATALLVLGGVPGSIATAWAQTPSAPAAGAAPADDPVTAIVNGQIIRSSDIAMAHQRLPDQFKGMPIQMLFPMILNGLIGNKLAAQEARKAGLEDDPQYKAIISRISDQLLEQLYMSQEIEARTTEEALKAEYDAYAAEVGGRPEIRASHILLKTETDAQAVIVALGKGGEFAALAKERSTGPSAPRGGDLGFFGRGDMVPQFEEVAFDLAPGSYTQEPVKTDFGWHVIKVEEKRQGSPPGFAESEGEVRKRLASAISEAIMGDLHKDAQIERFDMEGRPAK